MKDAPPILILTSCTATKALAGLSGPLRAEDLYAGQQHLRLMRGVRAYRRARQPAGPLRLRIVSAGHGLLSASTPIRAYDDSFQGLARSDIRDRADELGLPARVRSLLARRWSLAVLLLGDDYLAAIGLDDSVELGGPTIAFCGPRVALSLPPLVGLSTVALDTAQAKRFSCGLVSLKGELGGRMLGALSHQPAHLELLRQRGFPWLDWLDALPATATGTPSDPVVLPILGEVIA